MIKTKQPQLIDAQNKTYATVFFEMGPAIHHRDRGIRVFNITCFVEVDDGQGNISLQGIKENKAVFKEATFLANWGTLTLAQFEAQVDQIMIDQIHYINTYTWDGTEAQAPIRYWDLTSTDLEIVV